MFSGGGGERALKGQSALYYRALEPGHHVSRLSGASFCLIPAQKGMEAVSWLAWCWLPGHSPLGNQPFPYANLPVPALPSGPSPTSLGSHRGPACPPEFTKAGLSAAEWGRPTGKGLASARLPFLKETSKSSPVRQGEGVPLVKYLLTGLGREAVAMCERKVFCFGRPVQQGCRNGARHHPDQIRFDRSGVNKPPSTPLPLTQPEMFSFPLKTVSVS